MRMSVENGQQTRGDHAAISIEALARRRLRRARPLDRPESLEQTVGRGHDIAAHLRDL